MADEEESSTSSWQGTPTDANEQIRTWLSRGRKSVAVGQGQKETAPAGGELDGAAVKAIAQDALTRWSRERQAAPVVYAARELQRWRSNRAKGAARHADLDEERASGWVDAKIDEEAFDRALENYAASVGMEAEEARALERKGRLRFERGRFRKPGVFFGDEIAELSEAVQAVCRQEFAASWSKPWDSGRARLLELTEILDAPHLGIEESARSLVAEAQKLLKRAGDAGGPATERLRQIAGQLPPPLFHNASSLRRFVARMYLEPQISIAFGCMRPPEQEADETVERRFLVSWPRPRWVSPPDDREIAVVWLLCGGALPEIATWPVTAKAVIGKLRATVKAARKEVQDSVTRPRN